MGGVALSWFSIYFWNTVFAAFTLRVATTFANLFLLPRHATKPLENFSGIRSALVIVKKKCTDKCETIEICVHKANDLLSHFSASNGCVLLCSRRFGCYCGFNVLSSRVKRDGGEGARRWGTAGDLWIVCCVFLFCHNTTIVIISFLLGRLRHSLRGWVFLFFWNSYFATSCNVFTIDSSASFVYLSPVGSYCRDR